MVMGRYLRVDFAFDHAGNSAVCFGAKDLFITKIFPSKSFLDRFDQTTEDFHEAHLLRYILPG